jgi:hypothetical protein
MANPFNEQMIETPVGSGPNNRQSTLLNKSNRRSTLLVRPQNQSETPTGNPTNSTQTNDQLKREYEMLKKMNRGLETVLENFENASEKIQQFTETVNETDKLLDIWLAVLKRAEETKSVLEDKHWHAAVSVEKL